MFYPSLLIYDRLKSPKPKPQATPTSADSPEATLFQGNGVPEYNEIDNKIDNLDVDNLDGGKVFNIAIEIAKLQVNLIWSEVGLRNTYMGGACIQDLFQNLERKVGLDKIEPYGEGNAFTDPHYKWSASHPQFNSFSHTQRKKLEMIKWLANPKKMVEKFFTANPGIWNNKTMLKMLTFLEKFIMDFHKYSMTDAERKSIYKRIYEKHFFFPKGREIPGEEIPPHLKKIRSFLETRMKYGFTKQSLPTLDEFYGDSLSMEGKAIFYQHLRAIRKDVRALKSDGAFSNYLQSEKVGKFQTNSIIDAVLSKSDKRVTGDNVFLAGSKEAFPVRRHLFLRILFTVYNTAEKNLKISPKIKSQVVRRAGALERQIGIVPNLNGNKIGQVDADRSSISEGPAGSLVGDGPDVDVLDEAPAGIPALPPTSDYDASGMRSHVQHSFLAQNLGGLVETLEAGNPITPESLEEFKKDVAKLRAMYMKEFGSSRIVRTRELKLIKSRVERVVHYYEWYARVFADAMKLKGYEKKVAEFKKIDIEKLPAYEIQTLSNNYSELIEIYRHLALMDYLPGKLSVVRENLLSSVDTLHSKWGPLLNVTGKISGKKLPKSMGGGSILDDDDDSSLYSPAIRRSNESLSSYEIPEIMDLQLNRINLISTFADAIFSKHSSNYSKLGVTPGGFHADAVSIREKIHAFYIGDKKKGIMPKYDGKTPFNLKDQVRAHSGFDRFTEEALTLFRRSHPGHMALKKHITQNVHLAGYLREQGVDAEKLLIDLNNDTFSNEGQQSVMDLLNTDSPFSRGDLKLAGTTIAIIARKYIGNFALGRSIMNMLLYPHMRQSKINAIRNSDRAAVRKKARKKAAEALRKAMTPTFTEMVRTKIHLASVEFYKEGHDGEEPSESTLEYLVEASYSGWFRKYLDLQTMVFMDMIDNHNALASANFEWGPSADSLDKKIRKMYIDSVGGGGWTDWDDETWEAVGKASGFIKDVVVEIGLISLSLIPGIGAVYGGARLARWGLKLARVVKWAGRLKKMKRLATAVKWSGEVARIMGTNLAYGLSVKLAYPHLHNALTSGRRAETLFEHGQRKGWGAAVMSVIAESAMFAAFHGVRFPTKFLKFGKAGRRLHLLSADPAHREQVSKIFALFAKIKNPKEAERLIAQLCSKTRGIKLGPNKYMKVNSPIKKALRAAKDDYIQLHSRYFRCISSVEDKGLKKVLGALLQDGGFDMIAMILGAVAKHQIYSGDTEKLEIWNAETLFRMYTMGIAFRTTFVHIPAKIKAKMAERNAHSPHGLIEVTQTLLLQAVGEKTAAVEGHKTALVAAETGLPKAESSLRGKMQRCKRRSRRYSKAAGREKRAQGYVKKGGEWVLRKDIQALRDNIARYKTEIAQLKAKPVETAKYDQAIEMYKLEIKEFEKAIREAPLRDQAVPGWIASILPRGTRKHLWEHYRHKGEPLGNDGFIDLCKTDFNAAWQILNSAEKSILSAEQVIYVASRLKPESATMFLRKHGEIMTNRQRLAYTKLVQWINPHRMKLNQLPEDLAELGRKGIRAKVRAVKTWKAKLLTWFGAGSIAVMAGLGCSEAPKMRIGPKIEQVSKRDFSPARANHKGVKGQKGYVEGKDGGWYIKPGELVEFKESNADTPVVVMSPTKYSSGGGPTNGPTAGIKGYWKVPEDGAIKAYTKAVPGGMASFTGDHDQQRTLQKSIIEAQPTLDSKDHKGSGLTIEDKRAAQNTWARLSPKIRNRSLLVPSLEYSVDGKKVTGARWHVITHRGSFKAKEGFVFKTKADFRNTLKASGSMESGKWESLGRTGYGWPIATFLIILQFGAAASRIGRGVRGVYRTGKDRKGKEVPGVLEGMEWSKGWSYLHLAGRGIEKAVFGPWRKLSIVKDAPEPLYPLAQFPSLAKMGIRMGELTDQASKDALRISHKELKESTFRSIKFKTRMGEDPIQVNQDMATRLVKQRFLQLKAKEAGVDLTKDPTHYASATRQSIVREYNRVTNEIDGSLFGVEKGVIYGTNPIKPFESSFLRTKGGPEAAANMIAYYFKMNTRLSSKYTDAEIGQFRDSTTAGLRKVATFLNSHKGIGNVMRELGQLNERIPELEPEFTRVSGVPAAGRTPNETAFLLMYNAMKSRRETLKGRAKRGIEAADRVWHSIVDPMRESQLAKLAMSGTASIALYALWRAFGWGQHAQGYGKGSLSSRPDIDELGISYKNIDATMRQQLDNRPKGKRPDAPVGKVKPVDAKDLIKKAPPTVKGATPKKGSTMSTKAEAKAKAEAAAKAKAEAAAKAKAEAAAKAAKLPSLENTRSMFDRMKKRLKKDAGI